MGKKSKVGKDQQAIQREYTEAYNRIKKSAALTPEETVPRMVGSCADFKYWNRLPVVTLHQAICLTLDIEPKNNSHVEASKKRYSDLEQMVASHRIAGSLQLFSSNQIYAADWLSWLSIVAIAPPKEWQPIDNNGKKLVVASNSDIDEQVTDKIIIDAIADDIYNRMVEDNFPNIRRAGLHKIYDFLITKPETELPAKYQLPVMLYWLVDEEEDQRGLYDIGHKIHLGRIKIQYKNKDTEDCGSVPFLKVSEVFKVIKAQ